MAGYVVGLSIVNFSGEGRGLGGGRAGANGGDDVADVGDGTNGWVLEKVAREEFGDVACGENSPAEGERSGCHG